jgi:hypothetical protein
MKVPMFASVAVAALLAAAAQAAPEAAPADKPAAEATTAKAKTKPKMRRVCYENKGTGSRLERKTCVMERVDEEEAGAETEKAKPGA